MNDTSARHDGRHDFDFLHGRWQVRNERLTQRLAGSDDWEIFPAQQTCEPVLGSLGNVDAFLSDWNRPGAHDTFQGMTLRLFNIEQRQWSIWWAGNHDGVLEPPVSGGFQDGIGVFNGELEHDGRPVLARFVWSDISANTAHWHQQFSVDGGNSWETNWHMWMHRSDEQGRLLHEDTVIELRQYRMQPGRRDELIELFENEFIESQEAVGMHVIGQFRDLDQDDRYTWVRGFPNHALRAASLGAFYFGPTWKRHRDAANATLLDNDDVLMLKPAWPGAGFAAAAQAREPRGSRAMPDAVVTIGICALNAPAQDGFAELFRQRFAPLLSEHGAQLHGVYVTDPSPNGFARLPVREGESVLVWFAGHADASPADASVTTRVQADPRWRALLADALLGDLRQAPQWLRLSPTARSELRG
ncbi:NIPSNAP family protein [Lysobacter capsici]|uniref:NIPSNAP family protein n=1 Tax=Lysobacter capsici TaxID=435897 RepID=UPI001BFFF770|nr:NIPSNAP family protein [Lysobacter capsici]QWF17280.1 NIPSNAP family protein [Lysobacter capsici]